MVAFHAGRIMLERINKLLDESKTFALETTLSTKSYVSFIRKAKDRGYEIILLFLRLDSQKLAIERVKTRVMEGGHNIPENVIKRRYEKGLKNLFCRYMSIVDKWILVDNSEKIFNFIAEGAGNELLVKNQKIWGELIKKYNGS